MAGPQSGVSLQVFFDVSLTHINKLEECPMFISNYILFIKMPFKKLPEWLNTQS